MAKPWARANQRRRALSPDEAWADELEAKLLADCHPDQRAAVEDPARRISLLVGRGGGKTTSLRVRALRKMARKSRAKIIYFATTRDQARHLNWEPLKELLDRCGATAEFDLSESRMTATCKRTGSTYRMVGADDKGEIEKYRGQPFDEVQIDEGASHGEILEYLVDRIVGPRLGERNGCIVVVGSPGHILAGLFYESTRPSSPTHRAYVDRAKPQYKGWKRWSSHAWALSKVVALAGAKKKYPALVALWVEALIEKEAKGWSDDNPIWLREYLGLWAADNTETVFRYRPHDAAGALWNRWRPYGERALDGVAGLLEALERLPGELAGYQHVVAMDMGHSDPFACSVLSFAPTDPHRRIVHTFSFERVEMYARPIAELLIGKEYVEAMLRGEPLPAMGGLFGALGGWPVGLVMDADLAVIDELKNVYGIQVQKAEKRADYKFGAIELVNGDLVDGRIWVIEGSPLEVQLQQLQWKVDDFGKPRENKAQANHSTDTLVYGRLLISQLFETGVVAAEGKTVTSTYSDPSGLAGAAREPEPVPKPRPAPDSYESQRAPGAYDDPFA